MYKEHQLVTVVTSKVGYVFVKRVSFLVHLFRGGTSVLFFQMGQCISFG